MSSVVPAGWEVSKLEDRLYRPLAYGVLKPDAFVEDGVPMLRIQDVSISGLNERKLHRISEKLHLEFKRTQVREGDLVISLVGTIGRVLEITKSLDGANVSRAFGVIGLKDDIDRHYIRQFLTSQKIQDWIQEQAQGNAQKVLNLGELRNLSIVHPPLPEQKKIASILTSVDEVIENIQKQIDKLQDLKKATMNELLTKGIGHTEFKDSELGRIPESWEVVTLRDICKVRQGLQIPIAERFNQGGESRYPYLTVAWINSNFDANKAEFIGNPSKSVVLKSDEFVVGRTGAVGQIFDGLECVFHNNFFAVSLLHTSVEKEFLKHFLKWHLTQDLLLKLAGSTTIPDLNHGDFYSVNLRLPAPEEQQRIIRVLDHFDLEISTRKKKFHQTQSLKKSLMQDLLTGKVRVTVN